MPANMKMIKPKKGFFSFMTRNADARIIANGIRKLRVS